MVRGLNLAPPRRRVALTALVLAVLALHAWVTREVAWRMGEFGAAATMPPRISVSYVRAMELAPPPAAPPVVVARPRAHKRPAVARAPAPSASAPEAETVAAADPAPTAEPVPPLPVELPPAAESAAAAPPDAAASAVAGEAFDWPASTRLSYALTGNYRGEVQGDAQVEWIRVGSRYQVHIDVNVGPPFAPLITRRMSSEGDLEGDRLLPSRYDEDTRVVFREPRRVTVTMGRDEVVLANGERRERAAGLQDAASQFIQLAALFTTRPELLQVGNTVEVLLVLRNKIEPWIYDILGQEDLYTPIGTIATYHLKPRRASGVPGDLTAEAWYAPQLRYLPVRIRIRQDENTFADLLLARKPDIADK